MGNVRYLVLEHDKKKKIFMANVVIEQTPMIKAIHEETVTCDYDLIKELNTLVGVDKKPDSSMGFMSHVVDHIKQGNSLNIYKQKDIVRGFLTDNGHRHDTLVKTELQTDSLTQSIAPIVEKFSYDIQQLKAQALDEVSAPVLKKAK